MRVREPRLRLPTLLCSPVTTPEIEEPILQENAYWMVRKAGEAADYVTQLGPRGH